MSSWGARQLEELEAEERLAFACEKAPTDDPVISKASLLVCRGLQAGLRQLRGACSPHVSKHRRAAA